MQHSHSATLTPDTLRQAWRHVRRGGRVVRRVAVRVILLALLALLLGDGVLIDRSLRAQVINIARDELFDYVSWEIDAVWGKVRQELLGVHPYLPDDARRELVLDYLDRVARVQTLNGEIERTYADPAIPDPGAATAGLRAERDDLRAQLAADQPLVESIIEEQVSAVLVDEGFGVLGQVLPPVSMHFSELPMILIISPRDRIAFEVDLNLEPLTVEQRAALEAAIEAALNVSALIEPLGGLSLYPSMIVQTSRPARAFEVTAHEWAHHYLAFYPLGLEYTTRPETRIINETTATFFGRTVAQKVFARYYPELPPPDYPSFFDDPADPGPAASGEATAPPRDPDAPPPFDFGREMHTTRVTVDWMLAEGWVEGAETYMEYRRRAFVRNSYAIRKLNQAYFAFHGGYQGAPGAGGVDPTGPAVETLRDRSPDLHAFLRTLRSVTTRDELLAALERAR
jgi:hypothetical protein